jgi:hypothetical protein
VFVCIHLRTLLGAVCAILAGLALLLWPPRFAAFTAAKADTAVSESAADLAPETIMAQLLQLRMQTLLSEDITALAPYYDSSTAQGRWALSRESQRATYLHEWARQRGVRLRTGEAEYKLVRKREEKGSV